MKADASTPQRLLDLAAAVATLAADRGAADHEGTTALLRGGPLRLRVLIAGEAKRGKSSLANRLLGRELLPVGVIPVTAVPTVVSWAHEAAEPRGTEGDKDAEHLLVDYRSGERRRQPLSQLAALVVEANNPGNQLGIAQVQVVLHGRALTDDPIDLVDSPGLGSVWEHNTRAAEEIYATLDAVLVVLTADPPVTAADRDLLVRLHAQALRTFVLVNKIDRLEEAERVQVEQFTLAVCAADGVRAEDVFFGSVRNADDGYQAFRVALQRYLVRRSRLDAERGAVRRLSHTVADLADDNALELRRVEIESDSDTGVLTTFRSCLSELSAQASGIEDLAAATRLRVRRELNQSADDLRRRLLTHARAGVEEAFAANEIDHDADRAEMLGRRTVAELTADEIEAWRRAESDRLDAALEQLRLSLESGVRDQLAALRAAASELLDVRLTARTDQFRWPEPAELRLSYERRPTWTDPGLDTLRRHTPGAARRARRRFVTETLPDLIDRQVGQVRADLQYRLDEAIRIASSRLRTDHLDRLAKLRATFDLRRRDTVQRAQQGEGRRNELRRRGEDLARIAGELAHYSEDLASEESASEESAGSPGHGASCR